MEATRGSDREARRPDDDHGCRIRQRNRVGGIL